MLVAVEEAESDGFSGNILNIVTPKGTGIEVGYVKNFEHYRFLLDSYASGGLPALQVRETALLGDGLSRSAVIDSVDYLPGQVPQLGQQVVLIEANKIEGDYFLQRGVSGASGVNLLLDYGLGLENVGGRQRLLATLNGVNAHPQMESPSQGRSAGLSFVTQGTEFLINHNMNASMGSGFTDPCPGAFFSTSAGRSRYGSGSIYDLNSYMGLVGLDCTTYLEGGALTMGGFLELGLGDYEAKANLGGRLVRGEGDLRRIGGGIMAHFEFDSPRSDRYYVDSSLRVGQLRQDYSSDDFQNSQDRAKFNTTSLYFGGHVGLGRNFILPSGNQVDLYGRYAFTYLQGDSALVDGSAPVEFKAAKSHVGRVGASYSGNVSPRWRLRAGLGYEQEFGGRTKASTSGRRINDVDVSGGTAVGEFGVAFKNIGGKPVSLGLSVEGYAGRRKGLAGGLNLTIAF
ncbi:MAG: autotransporter outer membrane beta-barrel domain-containing protein [Deltaproteobacteria bacterium]|nr:autotransporter outer membrane beta-barrel domain-containing protein [Deltaproteobacteria bacterium]